MSLYCVAISDTHNQHDEVDVPDGDLLIHAGDATYTGKPEEIEPFIDWFASQPHQYKIWVPGNHDFMCQNVPAEVEKLINGTGIRYLIDQDTNIDGINFYGSPWVPNLRNWAFSFEDCSADLEEKFIDGIPSWTDVLITHGPPYGKLDKVPRKGMSFLGDYSVGSVTLMAAIEKLPQLKYHIFGHIHEGYGMIDGYGHAPTYINVSSCNRHYFPVNPPIIFDIPTSKDISDE